LRQPFISSASSSPPADGRALTPIILGGIFFNNVTPASKLGVPLVLKSYIRAAKTVEDWAWLKVD